MRVHFPDFLDWLNGAYRGNDGPESAAKNKLFMQIKEIGAPDRCFYPLLLEARKNALLSADISGRHMNWPRSTETYDPDGKRSEVQFAEDDDPNLKRQLEKGLGDNTKAAAIHFLFLCKAEYRTYGIYMNEVIGLKERIAAKLGDKAPDFDELVFGPVHEEMQSTLARVSLEANDPKHPPSGPSGPFSWPKYFTRRDAERIEADICEGEDISQWLNPHNHHSIAFQGRRGEIETLDDFVSTGGQFRIAFLIAPSGAGKTRLISQWMRPYVAEIYENGEPKKEGWDAGFVEKRDVSAWQDWEPTTNTLLIIDYTYNYGEIIAAIKRQAEKQGRENARTVRLVLIDHVDPKLKHQDVALADAWGDARDGYSLGTDPKNIVKLYLSPNKHTPAFLASVAAQAANLFSETEEFLADDPRITSSVSALMAMGGEQEPASSSDEERRDAVRHPLFAALVGQMLAENPDHDFAQMKRRDLVAHYFEPPHRLPWLKSDRSAYWQSLGPWAGCIVSAATLRRGLGFSDAFEFITDRKRETILDEQDDRALRQLCERVVSSQAEGFIKPYEPDILGETFFLKFLEHIANNSDLRATLIYMVCHANGGEDDETVSNFLQTISRLTRNLIRDDQQDDFVKTAWINLARFLSPNNFPSGHRMRQSVSIALGDVVKQLRAADLIDLATIFSKKVDLDDLTKASGSDKFIRSAASFLHVFDLHLSQSQSSNKWDETARTIFVNFRKKSINEASAILLAASEGTKESLNWIVQVLGEDVNSTDKDGQTALVTACENDASNAVKLLLGIPGIKVNQGTAGDGYTALMAASRNGCDDVVRLLLEVPDIKVNQGTTDVRYSALWGACENGHEAVVKLLLEAPDINVNQGTTDDGFTALMVACQNNYDYVVRLLLEMPDIKVNQGTAGDGYTALMTASRNGCDDVVRLLLEVPDIKVNQGTMDIGYTALWAACESGHEGVVKLLLEAPDIKINQGVTDDEFTALMVACESGHEGVVKLLLEAPDINVNQDSIKGVTALMLACKESHGDTVQLLLETPGIKTNQPDTAHGITALMIACINGHSNVVMLLLSAPGIDVNQGSINGFTALMIACHQGYSGVAEILLEDSRVDINKTDKNGNFASDYALDQGHENMVNLIQVTKDRRR